MKGPAKMQDLLFVHYSLHNTIIVNIPAMFRWLFSGSLLFHVIKFSPTEIQLLKKLYRNTIIDGFTLPQCEMQDDGYFQKGERGFSCHFACRPV